MAGPWEKYKGEEEVEAAPWEAYQTAPVEDTLEPMATEEIPVEQPPTIEAEQPNLVNRVGQDVRDRFSNISKGFQDVKEGEMSPLRFGVKVAGQGVAGPIVDAVGNTIQSGITYAGEGLQAAAPESYEKLKQDLANDPVVNMGMQAIQAGYEAWDGFSSEHPQTAALIEDVLPMAELMIPATQTGRAGAAKVAESALDVAADTGKVSAKLAASPLTYGGKKVTDTYKGVMRRTVDELDAAVDALGAQASEAYKFARESGVTISPDKKMQIVADIESAILKQGKLNPAIQPKTYAALEDLKAQAQRVDFDLEEFDQYRRLFRKAAKDISEDSTGSIAAINQMDDSINSLKAGDLIAGNTQGVEAWDKARKLYSKKSAMGDITDIVAKTDGDPDRIMSAFNRLSRDKKKMRGYQPEEKALIKKIGTQSKASGALKLLGKFGFDMAGKGNVALPTIAAVMGALPLTVAGTTARQVRKYARRGKVEQLLEQIESRPLTARAKKLYGAK